MMVKNKADCKNEFTYFKIAEGGVKDTSATYKITVDNKGIFNITKNMFDDDALIVEDNQIHSLSLLDSNKNEYVKDLLLKAKNRYSRLGDIE